MLKEGESFVYTACPGWGDHDYCAINPKDARELNLKFGDKVEVCNIRKYEEA